MHQPNLANRPLDFQRFSQQTRRLFFVFLFVGSVSIFASAAVAENTQLNPSEEIKPTQSFVVRKGSQIYEGEKLFRFLTFNIPELIMREEPYWGVNHQFEQRDALATVKAFGGRATRCYVMSVTGPDHPGPRHIMGARQYNEEVFRSMDTALAECNDLGVRLIVPFLDHWDWWGGLKNFSALRNKDRDVFYTDPQLKADYKDLVKYVLNRRNTVSGILYKDDPAILAWETGNELREAPAAWTIEMAAYIKSLDPNHLVIDGNDHDLHDEVLESLHVDIVVKHYYRGTETDKAVIDYEQRYLADLKFVNERKPFMIGEFGFAPTEELIRFANAVVDSKGVGAMIWSLRQHEFQGGFRWHVEGDSGFAAYHWPGFPAGASYDEAKLLEQYQAAAVRMPNVVVESVKPATPKFLPIETVYDIRWQGIVGATHYELQRSIDDVAWKTIAAEVVDSVNSPETVVTKVSVKDAVDGIERSIRWHVFCQDLNAMVGQNYSYRVRAVNAHSESEWSDSQSITVSKQHGYENVDLSGLAANTSHKIESHCEINSLMVTGDGSLKEQSVTIEASSDGENFSPIAADCSKNDFEVSFTVRSLPPMTRHLRIQGTGPLVRAQYAFGGYKIYVPSP